MTFPSKSEPEGSELQVPCKKGAYPVNDNSVFLLKRKRLAGEILKKAEIQSLTKSSSLAFLII